VRELHRLHKAQQAVGLGSGGSLRHALLPSLIGMALSFVAGMLALRWLSRWLEAGRWHLFGAYCLIAALIVLWVG